MRKYSREELLDRVVDALLSNGLAGASLRPLARAAGTSDRMLLYYFKDKNELLEAAFQAVAGRLLMRLEAAFPSGVTTSPSDLLGRLGAAIREPDMRPAMQLWIELAGAAGRGEEPHRSVSAAILDGFLVWIDSRLSHDFDGDRSAAAALILSVVDGAALLYSVGRADSAAAALAAGVKALNASA
ncbi:MAG: TetR family transcriptional regulator [Alphaproteobacteria bacterium]|nr:TetR family transcriptional regulator [Alphaproteobacteria bacterium]